MKLPISVSWLLSILEIACSKHFLSPLMHYYPVRASTPRNIHLQVLPKSRNPSLCLVTFLKLETTMPSFKLSTSDKSAKQAAATPSNCATKYSTHSEKDDHASPHNEDSMIKSQLGAAVTTRSCLAVVEELEMLSHHHLRHPSYATGFSLMHQLFESWYLYYLAHSQTREIVKILNLGPENSFKNLPKLPPCSSWTISRHIYL